MLRVLLATAVVLQHIGSLFGLTMTGSVVSVETFYIVSGFYMALILSEKYVGSGAYALFITNRFLRIFPVYWGILVLTVVVCIGSWLATGNALLLHPYLTDYTQLSFSSLLYITLANLIVFGQDIVMFLTADSTGNLVFTSNFWLSQPQLFNFLLVPQAWTLALELMFYLLAPILIRRSTVVLVGLAVLSFGTRLYTYFVLGFTNDPWTYRFFPSELMFFLSGMISFRIYSRFRDRLPLSYARAVWIMVIAATVLFQYFPGGSVKMMGYFALVTLGLPFIFTATRRSRADRQLGEMSYPVYLSHLLVFAVADTLPILAGHKVVLRLTVLFGTFLVSFVLVKKVSRSLEEFRQRRTSAVAMLA